MITGRGRFNLYLSFVFIALIACGCQTDKEKKDKQFATLRVHLEAGPQDTDREVQVPIYRAQPVQMLVQNEPFITEAQVASAKVVDALGGFDLQIQFDRQGTWLLQQFSANNRGRHFALFSEFPAPDKKGKEGRWLAAPAFQMMITSGLIQFTPDTTREEADQIAIGLNNIAKKNQADIKWAN